MKTAMLLALCATTLASAAPKIDMIAKPDAVRGKEIADMKWGMFICWSFSTFSGVEWTREPHDPSFFKATGCDTDQWCKAAKDAGMGYILFLTKHHDGFCLWDTKTTDLKVTHSPLKIDVLAALRKSCDKYGIKLALYFSEGDWPMDRKKATTVEQADLKMAQLKELLTQYGPVEYIWFDHAQGIGGLNHAETDKWVRQFQPNCFSGYNHGEAGGRISLREMGSPGPIGKATAIGGQMENEKNFAYTVAEFTYPILPPHQGGAEWFYSLPVHHSLCHPAEKLYKDYLGAVKYGNIFSLDVGPDYAGKLREIDVKTLHEVGRMIRGEIKISIPLPGKATASTTWAQPGFEAARAMDGDSATRWGAVDGSRSAWLEITLDTPKTVTRALIDEAGFARIQKFDIQAQLGGAWKIVATGTTAGANKKIKFSAPVTAQTFRLNINEANEVPTLGEFQLFE